MATDKEFTVAGVSRKDGQLKVRFATNVMRIKVLVKTGHEEINLIELEEPMSKLDAAIFLQGLEEFQDPEVRECIDDYIERNTPKEKTPKAKKVKEPVAVAEPADEPEDVVSAPELENEPF